MKYRSEESPGAGMDPIYHHMRNRNSNVRNENSTIGNGRSTTANRPSRPTRRATTARAGAMPVSAKI